MNLSKKTVLSLRGVALLYLLVLAPWLPRLFRFLAGRATEAVEPPRVITNEKVHRVTRFFPAVTAVVALGAVARAWWRTRALTGDGRAAAELVARGAGASIRQLPEALLRPYWPVTAAALALTAGSRGRIITDLGEDGWEVAETYGVLENLDQAGDFVARVAEVESVRTAFIVTDDDSAFQMVCRDLPSQVLPVRLYESYLQNFMLRGGH